MSSSAEKSLSLLRQFPRLSLTNLAKLPSFTKPKAKLLPGKKARRRACLAEKGNKGRQLFPALGYEAGNSPITKTTPAEPSYNYGYHAIRQYPPLSLQNLQLYIDMGRLDPSRPLDLASICNTMVFPVDPQKGHFGVHLTEEGADRFEARVNLEVQWASEAAIAAVERNGGVVTCAYFDVFSVTALVNPKRFFLQGNPIPRRLLPPADCVGYYSDPASRGYLADPKKVAEERLVLAQKYGYDLPEVAADDELMNAAKDPKQVFYGLEPGWIVSLNEKRIFKPRDKDLDHYYKS